jgi:hypothetical protein
MNKHADVFEPRSGDKLLLFSIEKGLRDRDTYNATRYAWSIDLTNAQKATLILGCENGLVRGVYVADEWLPASPGRETEENFPDLLKDCPSFRPGHSSKPQRYGFRGATADEPSRKHYEGKRVPDNLRINARGFRYSY